MTTPIDLLVDIPALQDELADDVVLMLPEQVADSSLWPIPSQRAGTVMVMLTAWPQQMMAYWLNEYFPQGMFRARRKVLTRAALEPQLAKVGLAIRREVPWLVPEDCDLPLLYAGKHRPGRYFDPSWRNQFPAFAQDMSKAELEGGLGSLWSDIRSGRFVEIAAKHNDQAGDYVLLFVSQATDTFTS